MTAPRQHTLRPVIFLSAWILSWAIAAPTRPPNVVIILTDDQGFAELGATGNPVIHTPHLDQLAASSVALTQFQVMPVCSPTRAGLMTGRYYYRTGVTDTWMGRSLMDPSETTLAEIFSAHGYRTGIFGKWHLGDNYPRRAMDQGFQETLVLNGGGLSQPGDPPDPVDERGAYFNATLSRNGTWVKTDGYVSDVITAAAIEFIEQNQQQPFFVYLPFNTPHTPLQVPEKYLANYPPEKFAANNFPDHGLPPPQKLNTSDLARVYGMIENIDDNVGRLLAKLEALKLTENTIVIFFSDNGCQPHHGYNGGLRDWKCSLYEGGIRQTCFIRWPEQLPAGRRVDTITSHLDIAPTLLSLCALPKPTTVQFDGADITALLRDINTPWPERTLIAQWHRGDIPERYRKCAVRTQNWKLVQPRGDGDSWDGKTDFQLYDIAHDPSEQHNVAAEHPDQVNALKASYDAWFDELIRTRDFNQPQRIAIGTSHENPVLLTRQDWRGPRARWTPDGIGYWELSVATDCFYDILVRFKPAPVDRVLTLTCSGFSGQQTVLANTETALFPKVNLPTGPHRIEAALQHSGALSGVTYVEITQKK